MSRLPARVRYPDLGQVDDPGDRYYMRWLLSTLRALPEVAVEVDPTLRMVAWCAHQFVVDGVEFVQDWGDWPEIPGEVRAHPRIVKTQYLAWMKSYGNIRGVPQISFFDWAAFDQLAAEVRFRPEAGGPVLHIQDLAPARGPRRKKARDLLLRRYGGRLETRRQPSQEGYWRLAGACSASVHVGGSWLNMLDRAQWQMMALGVATVSPHLYTMVGAESPVAGVHYVRCRDDLEDLPDVVDWCLGHPEELQRVGDEAAALFRRVGTPRCIWESIAGWLAVDA